jgi:hypothetical protein
MIRGYIDHLLDGQYTRSVFALADVPRIGALIAEMVRGGDAREVNDALGFVRDVVNNRMLPEFDEYIPKSPLSAALCDGIVSVHYSIRKGCLYTIGKIGLQEAMPSLVAAFERYLERDPLLLPDLMSELIWLSGGENHWEYLDRAAAAPLYLARWAALDEVGRHVQDNQPETTYGRRLERFYVALADDLHPFVRAEAEYLLAELRLGWEAQSMARGERRRRYRALRGTAPGLTFGAVTTHFLNYLYLEDQDDYTVDVMDAFAQFCRDQPFTPEVGVHAYSRAFAASQESTV